MKGEEDKVEDGIYRTVYNRIKGGDLKGSRSWDLD